VDEDDVVSAVELVNVDDFINVTDEDMIFVVDEILFSQNI
jgi:hypothetical protein